MKSRVRSLPLLVLAGFISQPRIGHAECTLWSQSRCDESNGAAIDLKGKAKADFRPWSFEGSGRVWGYEPGLTTWTSPAIAMVDDEPIVFVGSYDHAVYALNAFSGAERWKFNTGDTIHSAPVIYRNQNEHIVYVASNDRSIYAIDAKYGRQKWVYTVESFRPSIGGSRLASPCVGNLDKGDPILVVPYWVWDRSVSNGKQKSAVVALTIDGGAKVWETEVSDGELTAAVFSKIQGTGMLFLGSNSGNVIALRANDGAVVWKRTELDAVRSPPAIVHAQGKDLAITASKYGLIRSVDALTGKENWSHQAGDRITGSPSILGRKAYVGSYDRNVYGIEIATGLAKEKLSAHSGIYSSLSVIPEIGLVLFMAWDDMLHIRGVGDRPYDIATYTGKPLWNVAGMDDSNWSSPIAAKLGDRWLAFVGSYDGKFRAISLEHRDRELPKGPSNFWFWLSFPMLLGPFFLLARLITKNARARAKRNGETTLS